MRIMLTQVGGPATDITKYLRTDKGSCVLTQELERRAFQRTVEDVRLVLTNLRGQFSAIFAGTRSQTLWGVDIYSPTRILFKGFVDTTSIRFDMIDNTVYFDVFSKTKAFWERAKQTKLYTIVWGPVSNPSPMFPINFDYLDLATALNLLDLGSGFHGDGTIFRGFDFGQYATRQVRWNNITQDPSIGNEGRMQALDPNTTWEQLLLACAIEYNAEFFVDIETDLLAMRNRMKANAVAERNIDPLLTSDSKLDAFWIDDQKIDWLYIHSTTAVPSPGFEGIVEPGNAFTKNGAYFYIMTAWFNGEVAASRPTQVNITTANTFQPQSVRLRLLPSPISGTTNRYLYRFSFDAGQLGYKRLPVLFDNSDTTYTDNTNSTDLVNAVTLASGIQVSFNQWVRFNEELDPFFGTPIGWTGFILDIDVGANTPAGEILDVAPKLNFFGADKATFYDSYWVASLFKREPNFAAGTSSSLAQREWEDMFRTRRRIECKVKGIDYRVGDQFRSGALRTGAGGVLPNDFTRSPGMIVQRAAIDLIKEETELILYTI